MGTNITIEPLNAENWYSVCQLSVSEEQKKIFYVSNVYWIGSSRYEEKNELFAIKLDSEYVGLIGGGQDYASAGGLIEPIMIDQNFQNRGIAAKAIKLMANYLGRHLNTDRIYIEHKRNNHAIALVLEKTGFQIVGEEEQGFRLCLHLQTDFTIHSLREHPERAEECRKLLLEHFNKLTSNHPAEVIAGSASLPQGYFMLKDGKVVGWVGLHKNEAVSGKIYGLCEIKKANILQNMQLLGHNMPPNGDVSSDALSPWITPLLVHPGERGNSYGKYLLEHVRREAGKLGFKAVFLATGEIGYYERYGFSEIGLTTFTWGRPTKIYEHIPSL